LINSDGSVFNDVQSWADLAANQTKFTNGGYAVTYGRSVKVGNINITAAATATATFALTINSKTVTTTVASIASVDDVIIALYTKLGTSNTDVTDNALFTVTTDAGKLIFQTLRNGSGANHAFTYALKSYEDAATTTESTSVFTATVNALAADNNKVWIQLAATTAGAAGAKATSVAAGLTLVSLTASGTNTLVSATGDDNTAIQSASADTAESNTATVKANSIDNTAEIS
jgi:hypothetical protein